MQLFRPSFNGIQTEAFSGAASVSVDYAALQSKVISNVQPDKYRQTFHLSFLLKLASGVILSDLKLTIMTSVADVTASTALATGFAATDHGADVTASTELATGFAATDHGVLRGMEVFLPSFLCSDFENSVKFSTCNLVTMTMLPE